MREIYWWLNIIEPLGSWLWTCKSIWSSQFDLSISYSDAPVMFCYCSLTCLFSRVPLSSSWPEITVLSCSRIWMLSNSVCQTKTSTYCRNCMSILAGLCTGNMDMLLRWEFGALHFGDFSFLTCYALLNELTCRHSKSWWMTLIQFWIPSLVKSKKLALMDRR